MTLFVGCSANEATTDTQDVIDAPTVEAGGDTQAGADTNDETTFEDTADTGVVPDGEVGLDAVGDADTNVPDDAPKDTGALDSGSADTAVADTTVPDTGLADTGVFDTGFADTGVADTGFTDTGPALDAFDGGIEVGDAGVHVISIWGGSRQCSMLESDGTVWTVGLNISGKLGDNTISERHTPVQVHGPGDVGFLTSIVEINTGEHHNVAIRSDGTVWAWGNNSVYQLGDGTTTERHTPVMVSGLPKIAPSGGRLGCRGHHTLVIAPDGTIWAWGLNDAGQLGDGTTKVRTAPVSVVGLSGPSAVSGGGAFSLALMPDKTLRSWGAGAEGQLGDGTTTLSQLSPVSVKGLSDVKQVSAGWRHAIALTGDGTVWTWGWNNHGQLGDGTKTNRSLPYHVPGLTKVVAVSAGDYHTAVLRSDGTVWTWGINSSGELGDGTFGADRVTPGAVLGLADAKSITAREDHNQVLRSDDSVWSWGYNGNGQLGDGTILPRNKPVAMIGP